jgi:hypothetical protein
MLLSNLINVASIGQGIRKDLLRNLKTESNMMMEISRQFVHRATPLKIMTFIEQWIERPLTSLVKLLYRLDPSCMICSTPY